MGIAPVPAIRSLLELSGLSLDEIDRFEINEAFGAQVLACQRELGLDRNKLNVNGGAIAIGHPLGATGVRLALTLARELKRSSVRYGHCLRLHRRRAGYRLADRESACRKLIVAQQKTTRFRFIMVLPASIPRRGIPPKRT